MTSTRKPRSFSFPVEFNNELDEYCQTTGENPGELIIGVMSEYIEGTQSLIETPKTQKVVAAESTTSATPFKMLLMVLNSNIAAAASPKQTEPSNLYVEPRVEVKVQLPEKGFTTKIIRDSTGMPLTAIVSTTDETKRWAVMVDDRFAAERMAKLELQGMQALQQHALLEKEVKELRELNVEQKAFISHLTTTGVPQASAPVDQQRLKEVAEKLQTYMDEMAAYHEKVSVELAAKDNEIERLKSYSTKMECDVESVGMKNEVLEETLAQEKAQNIVLSKLVKVFADGFTELAETHEEVENNFASYIYEAETTERLMGIKIKDLKTAPASRINELDNLAIFLASQKAELEQALEAQKAELEKALTLEVKEPEITPVAAAPIDVEALTASITARMLDALDKNFVRKGEVLREFINESLPIKTATIDPTYHPLEALSEYSCEVAAESSSVITLEPNEVEGTAVAIAKYSILEGKRVQANEPMPEPAVEVEVIETEPTQAPTVAQPKLTVTSGEFNLVFTSGADYQSIEKSINRMLANDLAPDCDREAILQRLADLKSPAVVDVDAELRAEINNTLSNEEGSVIYKAKKAAKKLKDYHDPNVALVYIQEAIKLAYPKLHASMNDTALSEAKNILIKAATPKEAEASKTKKNHNSRKRDETYAQQILDSVIPKINEPGISESERETRINNSAWMIADSSLPTSRYLPINLKATSLVTLIQQTKPELSLEEILNFVVDNLKDKYDEIDLAKAIATAKEALIKAEEAKNQSQVAVINQPTPDIRPEVWEESIKLIDIIYPEDKAKRFELVAGNLKEQSEVPDEVILNKVCDLLAGEGATQDELNEGRARAANYLKEIALTKAETAAETPTKVKRTRKFRIEAALARITDYISQQWIPAGNKVRPSMNHLVKTCGCSKATVNNLKDQWQATFDELVAQAS